MRKVDLGTYNEDGQLSVFSLEDIYYELDREHSIWLAEQLLEDGYIEQSETVKEITNGDFSGNLDALKGVYYRLSTEEEEMLNNLFKKYL